MSKASKTRASEVSKKAKRFKKDQNRALYQSFRDQGTNKKRKGSGSAKRTIKTTSHPNGACGNCGCRKCNYELNSSINAHHLSCIYGKQFMPRAVQ